MSNIDRMQSSKLWQRTLAPTSAEQHSGYKDKLRVELLGLRDKVELIVRQIQGDLPGLTVHDITHLDALWETASIIAGDEYALNPLEGFILGSSILIHDAALCFEAYEGGRDGLRQTIIWKDTTTSLQDSGFSADAIEAESDFVALRHLHAKRAETILTTPWRRDGAEMFLIDDVSLRNHYGSLIGKIAGSHHWEIEDVERLPTQFNPVGPLPLQWQVNAIKLACLLRCADAAHFSNDRAPDFLYALSKASGNSATHWRSQNRIGGPSIDASDPTGSTVLYTSTQSFAKDDAAAWWLAYDTLRLVDRELRASNALLTAVSPQAKFQVVRVRGIESPERLSEVVQPEGWAPCSAEVHVSNIEHLVKTLGGEQLYGAGQDKLGIALRELLQNARDAVRAREILDPLHRSSLTVRVRSDENGSAWVGVEDNGVGMSERVLTGPLLDFGTSFWSTSLLHHEFPGLRSSSFRSVGRFGLGFYSVFMVADFVTVRSKPWSGGVNDTRELSFTEKLSTRPLLVRGSSVALLPSVSTLVELKLKPNVSPSDFRIVVRTNRQDQKHFSVDFQEYLTALCGGLDVEVSLSVAGGATRTIHRPIGQPGFNTKQWLHGISFATHESGVSRIIDRHLPRMRKLECDGRLYGYAAVSINADDKNFLGLQTIGGLATPIGSGGNRFFVGFMDKVARSARRESGVIAAPAHVLEHWGKEQIELLKKESLTPAEKYAATLGLSDLGIDPTPIAMVPVVRPTGADGFATLYELVNYVAGGGVVAIPKSRNSELLENMNPHIPGTVRHYVVRGSGVGHFLQLAIENNVPSHPNGIAGCLHRLSLKKGLSPSWSLRHNVGRNQLGWPFDYLVLQHSVK
ncbi:MAG: ATP-binding protein [Flavobacteriales bacterium]|nr:ATP-binding protein [Flavobacteriales bacterium]